MHYPKIALIILNWNGKEDTIECLESVKQITYPNYELLLVDNGSTDGSVECFRERYPEMEIIETGENLGFAEGNNVGIRRAMDKGIDYVLLLNNDTVVDPEFLGELVKVAEEDENIGIVGPKVCHYDDPNILQFEWKYKKIINPKEDYSISGCVFLIKRTLIKNIGLLDARYFLFFEENDYFARAKKAGYKVMYIPTKSKVLHKCSASVNKVNGLQLYYMTRNKFIFMKKYSSEMQFATFFITFFIIYAPLTICSMILKYRSTKLMKIFLRGVSDGVCFSFNIKSV